MEQYAIGLIIQNTDTLAKLKSFFTKAKGLVDTKQVSIEADKTIEKSVLKAKPEAEIRFFIAIAPTVAKSTKDVWGANNDGIGDYYLPNAMTMEFRGQDYSLEEIKQRLTQFIGEQWMGQYVIIDSVSDLTDLLTKFKKWGVI